MQQAGQGPGGPPPPMKVVYNNNAPAPAMISQTTTVQSTTRNNCCFYYLLVVQVIIMIMFGITMGGLTPVSPDKGAQTAYTSINGFAWQKILFINLDVYDDKISDDKMMTSLSFYGAFNFVQAAFGIGQTGTNPNGASDSMIYALADYSGTGCSMTYDQDIQVGSDGDPLKEIDFCSKYGGDCASAGKGSGALFVFCFLISLVLCAVQFMRVNKDSQPMMMGAITGQVAVLILSIVACVIYSNSCVTKFAIALNQNTDGAAVPYAGAIEIVAIIVIIAVFFQLCINSCCAVAGDTIVTQTTTAPNVPAGMVMAGDVVPPMQQTPQFQQQGQFQQPQLQQQPQYQQQV